MLVLPPPVATSDGRRIDVPIKAADVAELTQVFQQLTVTQQDWLILRFLSGETDEETTHMLNARLAVRSKSVQPDTVRRWKSRNTEFRRAYDLMASRMVDWAKFFVMQIEAGNAVLGALEVRQILLKPWDALDSRGVTAKMTAAQGSIERVVGKKQEVSVALRVEDLAPR